MTLPAIERDNGGDYVTRTRLSDLETVDTEGQRLRNHDAKGRFTSENDAARENGARRELTRALKEIRDAVQDAPGTAITPEESREVARSALRLYGAAKRSLGQDAPLVLLRVKRSSVNDALADYYTAKASKVGFDTERGMALVDFAGKCEQRAERAMTAAIAFAKAISGKPAKGDGIPPGFIDTEGETP